MSFKFISAFRTFDVINELFRDSALKFSAHSVIHCLLMAKIIGPLPYRSDNARTFGGLVSNVWLLELNNLVVGVVPLVLVPEAGPWAGQFLQGNGITAVF